MTQPRAVRDPVYVDDDEISLLMSTIKHCDRLYRLEQGKVVAEGEPAEMLSSTKIVASG